MKKIVGLVLVSLFVLSIAAFADTGSAKVVFGAPTLLSGKQMPAGDYKVTWTGEGNEVQVTITSADKKISTTVPAKVIEGPKAFANLVIRNGDGSLKELWFNGKTKALAF